MKAACTHNGLKGSFLLGLLTLIFLSAGCGGGHEEVVAPNDEGMAPEAVAVRQAFESAAPDVRSAVNDTLTLVAMGATSPRAYNEAMPQLEALVGYSGITPEQKQALEKLMGAIKSGSIKK